MKELVSSLRLALVSVVLCALAYPLILTVFASLAFPYTASGAILLDARGKPIGSERLAQGFSSPAYFWPRPSAVGYNAAGSGGSNLSPLNPKIAERALPALALLGASEDRPVPLDLVTASGSGLDPDISEAGALFQAARVAAARGMPETELRAFVSGQARTPSGFASSEGRIVNVLLLNLALDRLEGSK